MIVFSNTTPFIALSCINQLELFPRLFGSIHVAESVIEECAEGGRILVPDLRKLSWIISVSDDIQIQMPVLLELDRGEKQTIILAKNFSAGKVIIDERIGRRMAEYLGLEVVGTLGVLAKAKKCGYISSFIQAANAMRKEGIYYHPDLVEKISRHLGEPGEEK